MISRTVLLFVFGATIASAQFVPRLLRPTPDDMSLMPYLRTSGCPSGPALAPVICQFMQPNLGLFKPQLIKPSTYIPPLIVEKCDKPELEIKLPAREPIVIPEAPILPPITVPKFPVPVIPEPIPPMPIVEPCEPAPVAISSAVSVPVAPVLPPLEMPALPEIVEFHGADISETVVNGIDYQAMLVPEAPAVVFPEAIPGSIIKPLTIPPAPLLPPAPFPEIPVRVEIPAPMVIEEPCITDVVPKPVPMPIVPMPLPELVPMPIVPIPEPTIVADPCEPVIAPVVKLPITKAAILFLFGATLASAQFFPHMGIAFKSNGCPSGPELAPIICKFMQPALSQFKPQLIAPTTYIAPLIVEKCDRPQLQMDELPAPIEEFKPVVIPEPPVLPPMTIPKFPVPVIIEESPAPVPESDEYADIPVMPVNIPAAPVLPPMEIHESQVEEKPAPEEIVEINSNTIELESISVPQPPELPAFVMPEIPIHVVAAKPATPCLDGSSIVPAPIPGYIESLAPLPAAPELPVFVMPELPAAPSLEDEPIPALTTAFIEPLAPMPAAPELPVFIMPELPAIQMVEPELPKPVAPCLEDEPIPAPIPAYVEPLGPVPAAPELPAFVMPEFPTIQVAEPAPMPAAPSLDEPILAPIPAYVEPIAPVPAAPELPTFIMPELPAIQMVELEVPKPAAPCLEDDISASIPLAPLPAAPELPAFVMPELPIHVPEPESSKPEIAPMPFIPIAALQQPMPEYNMVDYEPMPIPQAPELPPYVMSAMPVYVADVPAPVEPCPEDLSAPIVASEYIQPLAPLPAAPELPPASLPELPARIEIPSPPVMISQPEPWLTEEKAPEPIIIPQPPALSEIKMPELPVKVAFEEPCAPAVMPYPFYEKLFPNYVTIYNEKAKEPQNILVPSQPIGSTPCVYNLVMQHVMPNMFSKNFRPMENVEIKPASFLPCS
ncbi:titin-like [Cydia pomonella]|uniref:titin-like n=1 Tax=Cydia pomonella TaxID=82600 RepID=UPI002ADE5D04|nr:titin-like [Cydia pomonella]